MAFYKKSNVIIIVKGEKMKLSKKEFLDILEEKEACLEAVEWVKEDKAETFIELWNTCEQADWMLWLLATMIKEKKWPSRKTVVLCACDCAETALKFVPEDELRPKIAIQTARKWITGKATIEECKKAAEDAYAAASYVASASSAAAYAAAAASSYAAYAAAYATDAYATDAASSAASYSAVAHTAFGASVKKEALKNMADIIRKRINFRKD
jgi:hypothetical protein